MKSGFLKHVNSLITQSDLVIEVVDARRPQETRNYNLERSVLKNRKSLMIVMNKSDLVDDKEKKNYQDKQEKK
jgi:ribosome biogenesis GTPase A